MWLALLIVWSASGHPHYPTEVYGQTVAFVSDVGARPHFKPVFISLATTTALTFVPIVIAHLCCWTSEDRSLRKSSVLRILSTISIILILLGSACLIGLTVLDLQHHFNVHYALLSASLPGYFFSGVLLCVHDYLRLRHQRCRQNQHSEDEEKSMVQDSQSPPVKPKALGFRVAVLSVEFVLLTLFSAFCWGNIFYNAAGVIEWCVVGIFGVYIGSFAMDF
ncbi:hypothetical protein NA57DRAFT_81355 [Rhizodiscina lignyota]|uniref:CWH43-like N-terminal domain-containing protein n=1 Tax=Rhizodiscina lignyota TaxID=1504668 RepID=A0A9P4I5R0_9PEZI|nr:hypothetical protein NA57DRAFT_81355 [Rhizodiscina lignyota]